MAHFSRAEKSGKLLNDYPGSGEETGGTRGSRIWNIRKPIPADNNAVLPHGRVILDSTWLMA